MEFIHETILIMIVEATKTWAIRCPDDTWHDIQHAETQLILRLWDFWEE